MSLQKDFLTMKTTVIALAGLLTFGVAASAQAQAFTPDGEIKFNGGVIAQSCVVDINGDGASGTVSMVRATQAELAGADERAKDTPFAVTVGTVGTPCTAPAVKLVFQGDNVNGQGRLNNTATDGAENVELVLKDSSGDDIDLSTNGNTETVTPDGTGVAVINLSSEYHATGAATAGDVVSSVEYQVAYP